MSTMSSASEERPPASVRSAGGPPRVDRRVRRTRRALQTALVDLATQVGYEALTVESITEHADVGRATFYLHFTDKADLLTAVADDLIGELVPYLEGLHPDSHAGVVRATFEHAAEHRNAYRLLLSGAGNSHARERILTLAAEFGERMIQRNAQRRGTTLRLPLDAIARLWSGQLINAIDWWLSGTCPHGREELADILVQQRFHGLAWVYGYDPGDPRLADTEL